MASGHWPPAPGLWPLPAARSEQQEARNRNKQIKNEQEKFEHKDRLGCEVTVFEVTHATCETDATRESDKPAVAKDRPYQKGAIKDNYNIYGLPAACFGAW